MKKPIIKTCKLFLIIFFASVFINNTLANGDHPKRIIAYFASWSDQTIKGNYGVDDIPWDKLTHINYAFAGVGQDFKISFLDTATAIFDTLPGQDPSLDYNGQLNLLTVYKQQFTDVKTLISVGGWAASGGFYEMTDDTNRMVTFANSCVDFIRDYGFDGIDIDFEYPSSALGCVHPLDDYLYMQYRRDVIYGHYLQLMDILRRKIDIASQEDEKQYLLTIAASASSWTLGGMKLGSYCKYIDYINIMTYDLHGTWNQYVGPQSALWASPNDPETVSLDQPTLNVDWAVKYYSGYMNPKDINIGIPYYSRGWIDVSGGNNGLWGTSPLVQHTYNYIYPGGTYVYTRTVGTGAGGLDGIWNDPPPEAYAGANPIWHVMNLLQNPGTAEYEYLEGTPWGGVQTGITGYSQHFDDETKTVWAWNSSTNTFLTFEDTVSLHNKLQYIADRGLGGMMFWELSGDYQLNQETGQFEVGNDMTTYAYNFFNNATLLPPVGRELPEDTLDFDFTFTGTYSHPNYTPQFQIINKTNEEIPAGWIVHFDLPKSGRWTSTWGTGTLSVIDDTHPYWKRYQIVGPSWQAIPAGGSVTITGAIKLSFSKGPLNVTLNGKISPYEKFLFPPQQNGEQEIDLPEGYSFVSSRIVPENPDMMVVLNDNLNENLDFVRNSNGEILRKIGPIWINGIGDWITSEGYLFKMNSSDQLILEGEIIDPLTEINLSEGYQFVSYLPEISANALLAFENILTDNLDYIRNSDGGMIRKIGPNWVNGIGNCNPGEGYLIKMLADDILIYSASVAFTCGEPFTDPRDGQTYNTVQIDGQCWMAENLNLGTMINGMEEMTDNNEFEKYCFDDDTDNCNIYGGLYTWNETMQYVTDSAIQGICPQGWRIPTDYEWKILEGNADSQYPVGDPEWDETGYRGFDVARNLKSFTTWSKNPGIDIFGFTALAGGYRQSNGNFGNLGNYTLFWSSNVHNDYRAWMRRMICYANNMSRNYYNKYYGFSVRCLRDNAKLNNLSDREKTRVNDLSDTKIANIEPTHFSFKGGNAADPVFTLYVSGLEIGDEVAVFDNQKIVGASVISSANIFDNSVPVFSTLNNEKGYESGNTISIKAYDRETGKEIPISFDMKNPYGDAITERYFPAEDGEYSIVTIQKGTNSIESLADENISIYPNPANNKVNIISNEIIKDIEVLNFLGQVLLNTEVNDTQIIINTSDYQPGVYIFKINAVNSTLIKKVTIK